MNRVTPRVEEFARRLIAYEAGGRKRSESAEPLAFHVCETLRPHLTTLMGHGGYRALLTRALTRATEDVTWLRAIQMKPNGSLEGLDELRAQLAPEEIAAGRVALLAQLLGLLIAFIGERLTVRLLHEVWPDLPLTDLESRKGDKK